MWDQELFGGCLEKEKFSSCLISLSSEKLSNLEGSEFRVENKPCLAVIACVAIGH